MFTHPTQIRVRYAETDQMHFVYYGNYATYFEVGRVEAMRSLGISYKKLEERGIRMPVLDLNIQYKNPALYDELLTLHTSIPTLPTFKMRFNYEIMGEDNRTICTGVTTLVFVDVEKNKPVRIPSDIAQIFEKYF